MSFSQSADLEFSDVHYKQVTRKRKMFLFNDIDIVSKLILSFSCLMNKTKWIKVFFPAFLQRKHNKNEK